MASSFERDFGYLLPFLDRVTQAASDHPDARVRAELVSLLEGEKARWARVRDLMAAGPGRARADALGSSATRKGQGKASGAQGSSSTTPSLPRSAPARQSEASDEAVVQADRYTVGSLRSDS